MTLVMGIETSCDETAVAIVAQNKDGKSVSILSNQIASQIEIHKQYGGVVPELSSRNHLIYINKMIQASLQEANIGFSDIDAIAVTAGPGLIGGLLVGMITAKSLAAFHNKPFIGVNHLEGHALSPLLSCDVSYPFILLLVTGGHCFIAIVKKFGQYHIIGKTYDDAIGEAFDKVSKMLGFGYPGGPIIEQTAKNGNPNAFKLPMPLFGRPNCDFSFSGLKTAVRRIIEQIKEKKGELSLQDKADICASFQNTICLILRDRLKNAFNIAKNDFNVSNCDFIMAGGVAANGYLRDSIKQFCDDNSLRFLVPDLKFCTDNAAMIALVGIKRYEINQRDKLDLIPRARWSLEEC